MLFALAGHLGKYASEIEAEMPSSEWLEWCSLLCGPESEPWGHYRSDALAMQTSGHIIAAPHAGKPGEMLRDLRLPWAKAKDQRPDGVRVISGGQMSIFLAAIGAKPVECQS